jgi:hypothetical protein
MPSRKTLRKEYPVPKRTKPPYQPTPSDRATVQNLAALGATHADIAMCLSTDGISEKTMRKYFRRELDTSLANVKALAMSKVVAAITAGEAWAVCFFLKCRAGWQETTSQRFVDEKGKDRPFLLTDADRLIAESDAADAAG